MGTWYRSERDERVSWEGSMKWRTSLALVVVPEESSEEIEEL